MRQYALVLIVFVLSWQRSTEFLTAAAKPRSTGLTITASVALEPFTGAPLSVSARIIRLMDVESRRENLALLYYEGAEGDYQLQGDLQAVQEENKIRLVYVWLVFDKKGELIATTSGMETVPSTGAPLWSELSDATLKVIADQGIAAVIQSDRRDQLPKAGKRRH